MVSFGFYFHFESLFYNIFFEVSVTSSGNSESKSRNVQVTNVVVLRKPSNKIMAIDSERVCDADVFMDSFFEPIVQNETESSMQGLQVYVSNSIDVNNDQETLRNESPPLSLSASEFPDYERYVDDFLEGKNCNKI